ncbi:acyltransferase family protein [Rhizobium leguminosarum]|uniref:Acyltransferase family protein n=1 Tax=Rhizobium leguminosarum TaxID=384 RepID=A0A6P0BKM5_RHILE|nr:acyltransferase family protein [Rhizobium leguminosarum]NEI45133.1 acyltransferase family protein [Rhizobium leguminosarum]
MVRCNPRAVLPHFPFCHPVSSKANVAANVSARGRRVDHLPVSRLFRVRRCLYDVCARRLDGLAEGEIVAILWRDDRFRDWLRRNFAGWTKAVRILAFGFIPLVVGMANDVASTTAAWGHTYLALLYSALLIYILGSLGSENLKYLRNEKLQKLGRISYTLYLVHPLILSAIYIGVRQPEALHSFGAVPLSALRLCCR